MIVADTNVLSEPLKRAPSMAVLAWLEAVGSELAITTVTVSELLYGALRLPHGRRRVTLLGNIEHLVEEAGDRVLGVDEAAARAWAELRTPREAAGSPVAVEDLIIGAICVSRGLPLATRNVRHFAGFGHRIMVASTSFRISANAKDALTRRAESEGVSATALLERLIVEGVRVLDHPRIVFRGLGPDRRAALAAGPDVWEVVSRLRELDGPEEIRIRELGDETGLHARLIRVALDYAAAHPDEIRARIGLNEEAGERSRRAAEQRRALLA